MGSIAEKLSYLNGTKRLLRRRINSLGGNITLETRFRDYLLWLDRFYNAASSGVEFELLGETEQRAVNSSANILPLYDDEIVTDGVTVTVSDGGKITINGTAERDLWIKITNGMEVEYTNPRPNAHHKWYSEKITEFYEPTSIYYQMGVGGGTKASTGNAIQLGYHDNDTSPESSTNQYITDFINTYPEKDIVSSINETNVTELNFVDLYLKSGNSFNTYGYIQVAYQNESNWVPNNDAAPASPDNPKYFWSPDDITYTASDGTEFPIWLTYPDAHYNFVLGAIGDYKDRIYYKNGKFYCERKTWGVTFDGTNNTVSYVKLSNAVDTGYKLLNDCLAPANNGIVASTLSNYFEAYSINDIINNKKVGIGIRDDKVVFLSFGENSSYTSASAINTWLSTHYTSVRYVLNEPVITEITEDNAKTLYDQLKAIIDHETKLEIEKKIF